MYMTNQIQMAINAINKWIFFGWNYSCVEHEWTDANGNKRIEVLPRFLVEVKWTCNFDHMLSKWRLATHNTDSHSYLVRFYAELGAENCRLLLEWVMENYHDERKIFSQEEIKERSEAQILAEIREWADDIPYYLSNREGYARGYREGFIRAHKIVMSIITGEPFDE